MNKFFLSRPLDPYILAFERSFEYSLNWRNSKGMYMVLHQGYHGGLSTEVFFKVTTTDTYSKVSALNDFKCPTQMSDLKFSIEKSSRLI